MKQKNQILQHVQPAIIAIVCFLFLLVATGSYTNYKKGLWEKDIRSNLMDILIGKKSKLEKALYSRIYYTRGVAAFVALKPDIKDAEFEELAKEYIKNDTVISTMALSRNCVINAVYPLKGHEAALGLNLLEHPERKEIVEKTIETHQTFVAGPVELVEGGIAFISYTPIFDKRSQNKNLFWGMTDIVIKQKSLFREAMFLQEEGGYKFALRGYNGTGKDGELFWGNGDLFLQKPVTINIDLPIGSWELAGVPVDGWNQYPNQDKTISFILIVSSLIISVLIWLFSRALLKIKQNEREMTAIFGSMDSLIVEFNREGEYLKIAPTNDSILFKPSNELIGRRVHEIFDPEKADLLLEAIRECLRTRALVVIEYPLEIKGKECWFSARVSFKTDETVIFNAFDITERKKSEELILQSEIRLKKLNEMKDKFFSIIAHDLRNPVGNMKVISELLVDSYDSLSIDQVKELHESVKLSSTNLHLLLEDLLEWARSQSGNIVAKQQKVELNKLSANQIAQFKTLAQQKEINLISEVKPTAIAIADPDLTGIVLRNIIANAIKFTRKGGRICISSEEFNAEKGQYLKVTISDNGVGMDPKKLDALFRIDTSVSTLGTENEQGTGLGLLLCKELIEKQGGLISVSSVVGEGSAFSFTLPSSVESVEVV